LGPWGAHQAKSLDLEKGSWICLPCRFNAWAQAGARQALPMEPWALWGALQAFTGLALFQVTAIRVCQFLFS